MNPLGLHLACAAIVGGASLCFAAGTSAAIIISGSSEHEVFAGSYGSIVDSPITQDNLNTISAGGEFYSFSDVITSSAEFNVHLQQNRDAASGPFAGLGSISFVSTVDVSYSISGLFQAIGNAPGDWGILVELMDGTTPLYSFPYPSTDPGFSFNLPPAPTLTGILTAGTEYGFFWQVTSGLDNPGVGSSLLDGQFSLSFAPLLAVPEPATLGLVVLAVPLLLLGRRLRR